MTVIKMMAMTVMDGTEKKSGDSKAGNTEWLEDSRDRAEREQRYINNERSYERTNQAVTVKVT